MVNHANHRLAPQHSTASPLYKGAAAMLLALSTGCAQPPKQPDVLLVTWDTVRADRVHCEREGIPCTPFFSELAESGVVFSGARSTTPETLPSHASLMTGLYPAMHGARVNGLFKVSPEVTTQAEQLQQAGYATGGFVSAYVLNPDSGIDRGFSVFDAREGTTGLPYREGKETTAAALRWLGSVPADQPVFLWLHLFDAHRPLVPSAEALRRAGGDSYQAQIHTVDAQTRRMVDGLRSTGRLDNSLVVITSDHGEDLGDHGEETHSIFAYDATVRIPMLWWWGESVPLSAERGSTVAASVSLVDVAPTLAALTGLAAEPTDGLSLADAMRGEPLPARTLLVESVTPSYSLQTAPIFGFIDAQQRSWFDTPQPEHYNLDADPGQHNNLYTDADAATLTALRDQFDRQWPPEEQASIDDQTRHELAALGYIGLDGDSSESTVDVKDRLGTIRFGVQPLTEPDAIVAAYRKLLAEEGYTPHLLDATLSGLDNIGALQQAEAILAELPDQAADLAARQQQRMEKERLQQQIQHFLRSNPPAEARANALYDLGNTLYYLERLTEAEPVLREALQLNPSDTPARRVLGQILSRQGQPEEAIAELLLTTPVLHCDIGRISAMTPDNDRTVKHLTACLELDVIRSNTEARILAELLFPKAP